MIYRTFIIIVVCLTYLFPQEQKVTASDIGPYDDFGSSVAISGNYAVIGAPSAINNQGAVYIFEVNQSGEWEEKQKLTASDGSSNDSFGTNVAINGEHLIVSSPGDNLYDPGINEVGHGGSVYFFSLSSSNEWVEKQKFTSSVEYFGGNIAISDSIAAIYSSLDGGDTVNVIIYQKDSIGDWGSAYTIQGRKRDQFGCDLAIFEKKVIIGAYWENLGVGKSAAYLFEPNLSNEWLQVYKFNASDGVPIDYFGRSVTIDNDNIAIGAPENNNVYLFENNTNNVWEEIQTLMPSGGTNSAGFGTHVYLTKDNLLVGCYDDIDDDGSNNSTAYIFSKNDDGNWVESNKLVPIGINNNSYYGISLALSEKAVLVGAPRDGGGSAFFYKLENSLEIEDETISDIGNLISMRAFPNPFNSEVNIKFNNPTNSSGRFSIYNIEGNIIKTIDLDGNLQQTNIIKWNGRNNANELVPSGIYFCRINYKFQSQTIKILYLQ